jgi:hypothetical protein
LGLWCASSRYVTAVFELVPYPRELVAVPLQSSHEGFFVYLIFFEPVGYPARGLQELLLIRGQVIGHL